MAQIPHPLCSILTGPYTTVSSQLQCGPSLSSAPANSHSVGMALSDSADQQQGSTLLDGAAAAADPQLDAPSPLAHPHNNNTQQADNILNNIDTEHVDVHSDNTVERVVHVDSNHSTDNNSINADNINNNNNNNSTSCNNVNSNSDTQMNNSHSNGSTGRNSNASGTSILLYTPDTSLNMTVMRNLLIVIKGEQQIQHALNVVAHAARDLLPLAAQLPSGTAYTFEWALSCSNMEEHWRLEYGSATEYHINRVLHSIHRVLVYVLCRICLHSSDIEAVQLVNNYYMSHTGTPQSVHVSDCMCTAEVFFAAREPVQQE